VAALALALALPAAGAAATVLPPGQPPPPVPGQVTPGSQADPVCGPVVPRPGPPRCAPRLAGPANALLAAVVRCETAGTGNPRMVSGRFGGLYQFTTGTWRSLGGTGRPSLASPGEQHYRAWRLWLRQGLAPWPTCGRAAVAAAR
jgi:hypothetical protein